MKRNILAVVIPALLVAGAANAAEIYNKDGNKVDLYGKVDVRHMFAKSHDNGDKEDGDDSRVRFGIKGETQITDQLTGFGRFENEIKTNGTEGDNKNKVRLAYAGFKFAEFGSIDYGRNYGVVYDTAAWTDVLPLFGGDTMAQTDVFMTGRNHNLLTYRNSDMFLLDEFKKQGEVYIATEDGSVGTKGNVLDAIRENALDAEVIYACGPTPMLRALKNYAAENNIECWISMEEKMACGIGACLACVCKSKEVDGHTNVHNKRVCKEGPVFLAEEVEL